MADDVIIGSGKHRYRFVRQWARLPRGWSFGSANPADRPVVDARFLSHPDDVKALAEPVLGHRIMLTPDAEFSGATSSQVLDQVLADVAPPSERGAA